MTDWPVGKQDPLPVLSPWSAESLGAFALSAGASLTSAASGAYPTASRMLLFPIALQRRFKAANWFWANGAAVSGNVDVGIYDRALNRLGNAGSTAQVGTSAYQTVSAGGLVLAAGLYYLGIACDNTTATFQRIAPNGTGLAALGALQLAASFPLPSSAAAAGLTNQAYMPLFGMTSRSFM